VLAHPDQQLEPADAVEAAVAEPDGRDRGGAQAVYTEAEEGLLEEVL
jgi:hypothetical protein